MIFSENPTGKRNYLPIVALAVVTGLGLLVRLKYVLSSDFPLNDGGLFYLMAHELQVNHYILPAFTSYNNAHIPYAYPPLSFYLAAGLSDLTGWPLLDIVRLLPAIVSTLTIPAFYLLARAVFHRSWLPLFSAVLAFALLPRSFEWHIMGGGIARAPSLFFAILALYQAFLLYTRRQQRFVISTAVFLSLATLSHVEIAWFAAFSMLVLFIFYGRNRQAVYNSLVVGASTLIVTAPWWVSVLIAHGISPLLAAAQTGSHTWLGWLPLITFNFSDEPFLGLLSVIGLLGVYVSLLEKKLWLPVWLASIFILDPRSSGTYAMLPLALLSGIGISRVIVPAISTFNPTNGGQIARDEEHKEGSEIRPRYQIEELVPKLTLSHLLVIALVSALSIPMLTQPWIRLSQEERQAMQWIKSNTPRASSLLLITGSDVWWTDAVAEWFPALTERTSLSTVQGYEWLPDFNHRVYRYDELHSCFNEGPACLEQWAKEDGVAFTYVYISNSCCQFIRTSLKTAPDYNLVYDQLGVTIFSYSHKHRNS